MYQSHTRKTADEATGGRYHRARVIASSIPSHSNKVLHCLTIQGAGMRSPSSRRSTSIQGMKMRSPCPIRQSPVFCMRDERGNTASTTCTATQSTNQRQVGRYAGSFWTVTLRVSFSVGKNAPCHAQRGGTCRYTHATTALRFPPSLWCYRHPHPGASTILGEQRHITACTEIAHETTTGCAPAHCPRLHGRPSSVPMRGGHRPCGARGERV